MSMYQSGEYLEKNPRWHAADSPWKAAQILKMIRRQNLNPATVCEVGCGAGEILNRLHAELPATDFFGYEVSPQAYEICSAKTKERLQFRLGDLLETEARFDLLLCIDVFEHVPDYLSFLERLRGRASRFIFHIPLDLSALSLLRPARLMKTRYGVGHLHMFTAETALAVLKDTGYETLDSFFTAGGLELEKNQKRLRTVLANLPRRVLGKFSPRLAARILGGYSLLVFAKPR
ncbi:MAG: class I SAM-dependent methyltransferase [Chloroflexi bacterium]|nr:methyltransferase domain-containing protein [Anaerolineae bacterium]MBL1171580.1 methyltransferase domain-containing protein [Chloroflexota bacterium]MDL1925336.1 class I SAM-dependent methyltransferase [Anaerolineae bacterium AMX1]NOG75044.1 class I SAM-dependent methyltransferase [Chloroflexota bacterium]